MRLDLVNFRGVGLTGSSANLLPEWRVGAILEAIAVRDVKGQLWLDIGGQRHPARIASGDGEGPQSGERLQVRVLRDSPVLALETLASSKQALGAEAVVVADALRRFVPRQESPALLLANLAWLAQGKNGSDALPKAVAQAAAQLWQALPHAKSLADPGALESALTRSGAFLESNLASGARASGDIKALLLSLGQTLREAGARGEAARGAAATHSSTPLARGPLTALSAAPATFALVDSPAHQLNELSRQTDGALARLTTTQLANSAADGPIQSMLIELPVRHEDRGDMLRLRIEHDSSRRNSEHGDSWSVEAAMDLGPTGALHAKVTLTGRRIGVQLRAESPAVVDALSARTTELESVLRAAGLEVDRVVCLHGLPAGDAGARAARLLDVRA
ncbi:MAG: flagellar hook-length control protein FliK [Steroidobacter sp.]